MVSKFWHNRLCVVADALVKKQNKTQIGKLYLPTQWRFEHLCDMFWYYLSVTQSGDSDSGGGRGYVAHLQPAAGGGQPQSLNNQVNAKDKTWSYTAAYLTGFYTNIFFLRLCQLIPQHLGPWNTLTIGSISLLPSGKCRPSPLLEVWAAPEFGQLWHCVWRLLTLIPKPANWELRAQI